VLKTPATMILYMVLPSKNKTRRGYNGSHAAQDDFSQC
jgi:hypothetical protein